MSKKTERPKSSGAAELDSIIARNAEGIVAAQADVERLRLDSMLSRSIPGIVAAQRDLERSRHATISKAIRENDIDTISELVSRSVSIPAEFAEPILNMAVGKYREQVVAACIEARPELVDEKDADGLTPIMRAARLGDRMAVYGILSKNPEAILQKGPDGKSISDFVPKEFEGLKEHLELTHGHAQGTTKAETRGYGKDSVVSFVEVTTRYLAQAVSEVADKPSRDPLEAPSMSFLIEQIAKLNDYPNFAHEADKANKNKTILMSVLEADGLPLAIREKIAKKIISREPSAVFDRDSSGRSALDYAPRAIREGLKNLATGMMLTRKEGIEAARAARYESKGSKRTTTARKARIGPQIS